MDKYRTRHQLFNVLLGLAAGLVLGGVGLHFYEHWNDAISGGTGARGMPAAQSSAMHWAGAAAVAGATASSASFSEYSADVSSGQGGSGAASEPSPELKQLWAASNAFESTMKSCFGSDCYNFAFDPSAQDAPVAAAATAKAASKTGTGVEAGKVERIGFLSPDLRGMDSLLSLLSKAAKKDLRADFGGSVSLDTHVPPYGYGKNHGWTRIVRFARRVAPQAESLLRAVPSAADADADTDTSMNPELYGLQVRQLVRWHCRLSHVAAHTRMLTVFLDDLVSKPLVEIYKILSFVGYRPGRGDMQAALQALGDSVWREMGMSMSTGGGGRRSSSIGGGDWRLAADGSHVAHSVSPSLWVAGTEALRDELSSTRDLQEWPCKTFKDLALHEKAAKLPLGSADLAPNCGAPYVKCSVAVDRKGG